jgi:hypothetical protein
MSRQKASTKVWPLFNKDLPCEGKDCYEQAAHGLCPRGGESRYLCKKCLNKVQNKADKEEHSTGKKQKVVIKHHRQSA